MVGVTLSSELRGGEGSAAHGATPTENRYGYINVRIDVELHDVQHATRARVFAAGRGQRGKRSAPGGSRAVRADYRFE